MLIAALLLHSGTAAAQTTVWSATLTVKQSSSIGHGCSDAVSGIECSSNLAPNSFTHEGTNYRVFAIRLALGTLAFTLDKSISGDQVSTLHVGNTQFSMSGTGALRTWTTSITWTANQMVSLSLTQAAATPSAPPPPPPPPPPPVITSAEGVTYSGNATEGFSLTPLGEGGNIVYRRRTIDLSVTRDECPSPDNPAMIISRSTLDRVREITFELKELSPHDPPAGFRMEGCTAEIDPGVRLGQRETVTVCLPPAEIKGESHVHRYDGEWERLPSRLEEVNKQELLCGETDSFSLFGVFVPVIESAEGVSHSEDQEAFFLTPLGVGGSIVYGERTIDISVTGDVASSNPAVIVPRNVLDRVEEITFELQGVSPHDPPQGLRLEGFTVKTDLGVTLGEEETVMVCLPQAGGDIYSYNDQLEEWELLTSLLETVNGEELLCAETGAFSLTGVFVEETGGCTVAAASGEETLRWRGALFNLLLIISALLLLPGRSKLK